jgi:hypothetical protein
MDTLVAESAYKPRIAIGADLAKGRPRRRVVLIGELDGEKDLALESKK